jgi:hypothetical protein
MKRFATSMLVLTSLICGPALAQSARPAADLGDRTLTADAKTAADGIDASLGKVEQAFGMGRE